ncbi:MAG: glyoxylase I family protein [Gammaproteobacteria bacterium]|jgi:glyoxylase I family protein
MIVRKLHHVAYRCTDAQATVEFYTSVLGLKYSHAVRNDYVPSTGEFYPHLHIFFEMDDGSSIAFFETPTEQPMGLDPNTPQWVQHLALEIDSKATQQQFIERFEALGIDYIGPTDHGFVQSIYFFDPSGHRLELTYRSDRAGELDAAETNAPHLLTQWLEDRQQWSKE